MAKTRVPIHDDDVQTAYQIHTIAQLLYARLIAASYPPVIH
jgi:hypothetical protein